MRGGLFSEARELFELVPVVRAKPFLTHIDPAFAEGLTLKKITDTTIVSYRELLKDLLAIRERGWSVGNGECVLGAFGIGVPFFIDGEIVGAYICDHSSISKTRLRCVYFCGANEVGLGSDRPAAFPRSL